MESYSVFLPSYSVGGADVYKKIPEICRAYGKTAVVIGGKTAMAKAKDDILAGIAGSDITISDFIWYGDDATYENVEALKANDTVRAADMIFAVGGGRALDTAKAVAGDTGQACFTFPTIASNCAASTSLSVMYNVEHVFIGCYFRQAPAHHTFINMDIIAKAPLKYLWAGLGDAMSKQYEVVFSARGDELDHTNQLGVDIAANCSAPLLKYGTQAYNDAKEGIVSEALIQCVLNILVTTGLVSVLVDTNLYNGALGHTVYYASTVIEECEKNHLHGEIVGYGILPQFILDDQPDTLAEVYAFNRSIDLPTTIAGIGIELDTPEYERFLDAAEIDRNIQHVPFPITRDMLDKAIRAVDAYDAAQRGQA